MKSRVLSDMKPIKPKKCEFDSNDCTPVCKYYKTCIHSLHKQAVYTYIEERKNHENKQNRHNLERMGTNVRKIKEIQENS